MLDFAHSQVFSKRSTRCPNCDTLWESSEISLLAFLEHSSNIESIDFSHCSLSQDFAEQILYSLSDKSKVQEIKLEEFGNASKRTISSQVFEKIFRKIIFSNLEVFHLSTLKLRVRSDCSLHISCGVEDDKHFCLMLEILSFGGGRINKLCISYFQYRDGGLSDRHTKGFDQLLSSNCGIKTLDFSGSLFSDGFFASLALSIAASKGLQKLCLNSTKLKGSQIITLLKTLAESVLEVLDISENSFLEECNAKDLGVAFQIFFEKNYSMKIINLSKCELNGEVIQYIAKGLITNTTLMELDISNYDISIGNEEELFIEGIRTIITQNKALKIIKLSSSSISDAILAALANTLNFNITLQEIYLDAWAKLFTSLKCNRSLHTLSLCYHQFNAKTYTALKELLQTNKDLSTLRVINCNLSRSQVEYLRAELPSKESLIII